MTDDHDDEDTQRISVDLSPDEPADESGGTPPQRQQAQQPGQQPASDDAGVEEARRYLQDADGASERERAENAMAALEQEYRQTREQLQQVQQQKQTKEQRRENLEETKQRVVRQPPDGQIFQQLVGGISFEVPPAEVEDGEKASDFYDRDDLHADIEETREELADQIATLTERERKLEDVVETTRAAHEKLAAHRDVSSGL